METRSNHVLVGAVTLLLLSRALERSSWRYGFAAGMVAGFVSLGLEDSWYNIVQWSRV